MWETWARQRTSLFRLAMPSRPYSVSFPRCRSQCRAESIGPIAYELTVTGHLFQQRPPGRFFFGRSIIAASANPYCRLPIEMSPLSPFQMSLSWPDGCWERATDDGDCDEPQRDRPHARAQGSGSWPDYGERGCPADAADAPPRVSAGQGVLGARAGGAGLDPPRQAEQPPLSGGAPNGDAGADQGQLRRLRSDAGPREAGRATRHPSRGRDGPAMDAG